LFAEKLTTLQSQCEEMHLRPEEMHLRSEEMHLRSEEMHLRSEEMQQMLKKILTHLNISET